ncbi:protein XRI1 isoform X2 [Brachypodium distachyon]|uniref:Protein XRI1 n=2 Tax=Brachypodium distachyon TaxID=15368 RepID=I1IWX4_BRADI|nr:protein XRI1 isoform X2 [Brachypodium distachyon]KQJ82196.1 hypothetical protein BRADI_5g07250v3 [Brachypodium distachyon]|eukprot:XP_003579585.1 protein XRI1 isoform X2 [Brachypodium distachyon]
MDPRSGGGGGGAGAGAGDDQILWDWQAKEHCEPSDANHDVAKFVWDCLNQDDDDDELFGMLGNQTPLRDCRSFFDIGDISCKETLDLEESRESKRRRVLEYPSEFSQPEFGDHEMGSTSVMSEVTETSLLCTDELESLNWDVQHNSNNLDKTSSLSIGAPYRPSDNHSESCSDGTIMYHTPDQMPSSQESVTYIDVDGQTDVQGTTETAPVTESLIMQETRKLSKLKVSKGGSSLIKVKQNITTTIAYPFTLIKPSWEEGDVVTLKDINQRIHAPPKKPPEILGTSAFSGKPVINKTRIRTEGGKGSITILRTKG